MRVFSRRPNAGHVGVVLASLALFVSLGGVSAAANAINGKLLKKGSVSGSKIKNNTLTSSKIKNKTVSVSDLGRNSVRGSKADASGKATLNFGALRFGQCQFQEASGVKPASGDLNGDALVVTPSNDFDSNGHFSFESNPSGPGSFTVTVCNAGGPVNGAEDPDGPSGTTYRYVAFGL